MSKEPKNLEQRDGFQSKWGFILACIGSAVGMGSYRRFKDDVCSRLAHKEPYKIQRAMRAIKEAVPNLVIVGDVCLCQYTTHGLHSLTQR